VARAGSKAGKQRDGPSGRARLSTHTPLPDPSAAILPPRRAPWRGKFQLRPAMRNDLVTLVYLTEIHRKYGRCRRQAGGRRGAARGRL
jgi:hypothetical protein